MAHTQKHRRKMPSFSSTLLDAIYSSIDDPVVILDDQKEPCRGKNNGSRVEQEVENLRRAIRVEKWIECHTTTPTHLSSNSGSSTDSSIFFSSSETESSGIRKSSGFPKHVRTVRPVIKTPQPAETPTPKREGRFTRTKSRALKIYGDLKKAKNEPNSPGRRIANFLNSIFSPRRLRRNQAVEVDEWCPMRKSRSMKDTTMTLPSSSTTSCLNENLNKSKRSVKFCPVSTVILDPCGQKTLHGDEYNAGSWFSKKNTESCLRRHDFRGVCEDDDDDYGDDESCASSDLFELENIRVYEQELPVYGTTSVRMNLAIANGVII
ncbi:hypothetical protein OROMI_018998 [Orobanche minor]